MFVVDSPTTKVGRMHSRLYIFLLLCAPVGALRAEPVRQLLDQHCVSCHSAENKNGGLDLEAIKAEFSSPVLAAKWVKIHDRISSGEMPPKNKPRPAKADTDAALKGISDGLIAAEKSQRGAEGRRTIRRLNRTEFENTLRDLLDLPGLKIKDMLPDDGRAFGYDKSANALDISPILIEKYAEAIDQALNTATAGFSVPPELERRTMYANQQYDFKVLMSGGDAVMLKDMKYDDSRFPMPAGDTAVPYPKGKWGFGGKYQGLGEAEKAGVFKEPSTVGMTRTIDEANQYRFHYSPIHPGRYRIIVSAWAYWWDQGEVKPAPRNGALGIYLGGQLLGHVDAPSLKPTQSELTVWIDPKPRDIFKVNPASLWNVHVYFSAGQIAKFTGPGVAIDSFTIEGPLFDEWPPPSHRRLFGNNRIAPLADLPADAPKPKRQAPRQQAHDASNGPGRIVLGTVVTDNPKQEAERLLAVFLPRAFRRPVTPAEINRHVAIAHNRLELGWCFEDAMKAAYKSVLLSPDFLFLKENAGPLDQHAVAARMSYFLWNSMPDDQLLALANQGKLNDAQARRLQTERMLNDPKSERFIQDFLNQWLDLREFDSTTPDKALFPEFTPYLEDAMRKEPYEFFRLFVRENHQATQLLSTSINVLNQRIAEHYGIPNVSGTRFRRVDVDPAKSHRGGFLSMAAIMKVTANGTTTSPVKRGAWVLKKILGQTPEQPPPDVAAVEPDVKGATTIREQLAKHRDHASCASCHRRIDPPGFALECFDPIGNYRQRYRSIGKGDGADLTMMYPSFLNPEGKFPLGRYHVGYRIGLAVDTTGETTDGQQFKAIDDYRPLLVRDPKMFTRNLANQFITYATGSPVNFTDRAAVESIIQHGEHHKVRSLIHAIINSPLFLEK